MLWPLKPTDSSGRRTSFPASGSRQIKATVIGVGAIGRQVALQLAAIGVPRLQLVDFDLVDLTNVTTQGYQAADIGQPKVVATAAAIRAFDPAIAVEDGPGPLPAEAADRPGGLLLRGFDRRPRGHLALGRVHGAASGPTAGCSARSSACWRPSEKAGRDYYPTTLFAQSEAQPGRCTARSTIYAARIAAGPHGPSVHPLAARPARRSRHDVEPARGRVGQLVGPSLLDTHLSSSSVDTLPLPGCCADTGAAPGHLPVLVLLAHGGTAMTQHELNRAIARATGESVTTISSLGFVPLTSIPHEREPLVVDWDDLDAQRRFGGRSAAIPGQFRLIGVLLARPGSLGLRRCSRLRSRPRQVRIACRGPEPSLLLPYQ